MIEYFLNMNDEEYQQNINIDTWVLSQIYFMDDAKFKLKDYISI
jgi:hypothetical protein